MFYKMIENKCNQWYNSDSCTVKNLIEYIEKTGQMRDAQISAIKTYLFLKNGSRPAIPFSSLYLHTAVSKNISQSTKKCKPSRA